MRLSYSLIAFLIILNISCSNQKTKKLIIGTWESASTGGEKMQFVFKADGTLINQMIRIYGVPYAISHCKYEIIDGTKFIMSDCQIAKVPTEIEILEINEEILTLKWIEGTAFIFKKVVPSPENTFK